MYINLAAHRYRVIIIGSVILLILITAGLYFLSNRKIPSVEIPANNTDNTMNTPIPIPTESLELPPLISDDAVPDAPATPIPQPGDIILDGIAVRNFRENAVRITENNDVVIAETEMYQIVFYDSIQEFKIIISGSDFEKSQKAAESDFLKKLRIDKGNACRLYVSEFVPSSVKNDSTGKTYSLSFCYDDSY